jgi:hypothetical protein
MRGTRVALLSFVLTIIGAIVVASAPVGNAVRRP